MTVKEKNINVEEVATSIRQTLKELKELREGGGADKLSSEDKAEILIELDKATLLAYQIKLKPYLEDLYAISPDLPFHKVVINLLAHIRPDTSTSIIVKVVQYIATNWESKKMKMAA